MEIKINEQEKKSLMNYINCKMPLLIKGNLYSYKFDLMECYEEMFNASHSLIDGYKIQNKEIYCIFEDEFIVLLDKLESDIDLKCFCLLAKDVIKIIKKYGCSL